MRIAFDVFGGDNCPDAAIEGCRLFLSRHNGENDLEVLLFGDEDRIRGCMRDMDFRHSAIKIVHAPDVIGCDEQPTMAMKRKQSSSMMMALRSVSEGEAECVVSSGNTGALLTGATFIVKRIRGVKRPALVPTIPKVNGGYMLLIDAGANADCKPEYMLQFARMAKQYIKAVLGIDDPKTALLSNGAEAGKGNELVLEAHKLLSEADDINFCGNCEANNVLNGDIDILVCDGFSGNILLKSLEGTVAAMMSIIKRELMKTRRTKLGGVLIKPGMYSIRETYDPRAIGGAMLLGVDGGVIKAHGNSDAKAFSNALELAYKFAREQVVEKIRDVISSTMPEIEE